MEVRTSETARGNIENFAERFLELEKDKKVIGEDIKALKEEFKEEGVPVAVVVRVINTIKAEKKKSDTELFELEKIKEYLEASTKIDDSIGMLIGD